jgi:hypothetical protein
MLSGALACLLDAAPAGCGPLERQYAILLAALPFGVSIMTVTRSVSPSSKALRWVGSASPGVRLVPAAILRCCHTPVVGTIGVRLHTPDRRAELRRTVADAFAAASMDNESCSG